VACTIAAPKTTLTVFLSIHSAIFINWLPPGEKFNSGYFCEKILELLSQVLRCGLGEDSPRPVLYFDNAPPYQSPPLKIVSRAAKSDTLPNLPIPVISIHVSFLYSVI
jgi:hypothetical protein